MIAARSHTDFQSNLITSVTCDVSSPADVQMFTTEALRKYGSIDALVTCAGISGGIGKFYDLPIDSWENAFKTNVMGTLYCVRAVVPTMKKQGGGKIILLGGAGQGALPGRSAYAATKGAISRMTETFAEVLYEDNIYLNAVLPGPVNTRFMDEVIEAGPERTTQA